jgi:hypothetical protein
MYGAAAERPVAYGRNLMELPVKVLAPSRGDHAVTRVSTTPTITINPENPEVVAAMATLTPIWA